VRFWDASALTPLCLDEGRSTDVDQLVREDPRMTVWWATPVECASAIARRRRDGVLSPADEVSALEILGRLADNWFEVQAGQLVRSHAFRLLRVHPLRAADAFQLAAALVWAGTPAAGPTPVAEIVTLDGRLAEAARLEGLSVLPAAG
jgi:predicted nucleic acid-binding protein